MEADSSTHTTHSLPTFLPPCLGRRRRIWVETYNSLPGLCAKVVCAKFCVQSASCAKDLNATSFPYCVYCNIGLQNNKQIYKIIINY